MRYFCSPNQKTVLRTRRIVELRSGPKDAKVAKKVPYLESAEPSVKRVDL